MARSKTKTTDAVEILRRRFVENDAEMAALVRQERQNADIAQKIYDLRTQAKLSQQQLADLVGTTASVICRLEDSDYEGHSLNMLHRIAAALGNRIEVRFVPVKASAPRKVAGALTGVDKAAGKKRSTGSKKSTARASEG
jgi:transcriptional regulator with XRE-family HTH domain